MSFNIPKTEGVSPGYQMHKDTDKGPPLRMLHGKYLDEIIQEHKLFTYAPLFLYGGLKHNPVQEWLNISGVGSGVYVIRLDKDVINLSQSTVFNKVLWVVKNEYAEDLFLHIGSMAFMNEYTQKLTRVICQQLTILDITAATRDKILPNIPLTTFSVDRNDLCLAFEPDALTHIPKLIKLPTRKETIELAEALFKQNEKPYDKVQK